MCRNIRHTVAPALCGSILSTNDYQLVSKLQFCIVLYDEEVLVGKPTGVQPGAATRRWWLHGSVDSRRLKVAWHADVEPQLVQIVWNATTDVTAKRVTDVVVDRLKCISVRIACSKQAETRRALGYFNNYLFLPLFVENNKTTNEQNNLVKSFKKLLTN